MPTGPRQRALRTFGVVVRRLAQKYRLLRADITAISAEKDVMRVYRRLCKTVHPDKGGTTEDFQDLNGAYKQWRKPELTAADARPAFHDGSVVSDRAPAGEENGGAAPPADDQPRPVMLPVASDTMAV